MKAALIPPIPELAKYGFGDFHLLLSHLMDIPAYANWYRKERLGGSYIVLDNSAHEFKVGLKARELTEQAIFLEAQEVVVPDALFDAEKTIDLALETLEAWFENPASDMLNLNPALMYVPQGSNEIEWMRCARELVRVHTYMTKKVKGFRRSFVLGISKDYDEQFEGGLVTLMRDYVAPLRVALWEKQEIKMQVHMLGWMRNLWQLAEIALEFPWVRSTDSAKPFVYGNAGITLNTTRLVPPYPTRPENYFELVFDVGGRIRSGRNISTFKKVAAGKM